jgi:hypothetical protein
MEYLNSSEYLYKKPLSIIAISLYDMNAILKQPFIEMHVSWQGSVRSYIWVLGVSILPLSIIFSGF